MNSRINDLPLIERPREKIIKYGVDRLNDEELLAVILRTGIKGRNIIKISKTILNILKKNDGKTLSYKDFSSLRGVGPVKVTQILATIELGKRLIDKKTNKIYLKPDDIWRELIDIRSNKKEHFIIFFLDSRNQEIKREIISIGSLNASIVHPREVFEPAIINLSASIILSHNHPSGVTEPSDEDIELTKILIQSGKILGIEIVDHIIVTVKSYYSFKENNKM